MSKTILAQVDGWTPVIDGVVSDVGATTALVFGKMWRYCQMADGVCKASQERIADELGLSRQTVNTHIEKLVSAGYMKDTTPDLQGAPHVYKDTGKANLSINLTATCQKSLQPPVKEFDIKKEDKKESIESDTFKIIHSMQSIGMFPNSMTHSMIEVWLEKHSVEWIIKALEKSKGKNQNYVDKVLVGWEANGYPKTREELIAAARQEPKKPQQERAYSLPSGV